MIYIYENIWTANNSFWGYVKYVIWYEPGYPNNNDDNDNDKNNDYNNDNNNDDDDNDNNDNDVIMMK